jgi:hypothetical protein
MQVIGQKVPLFSRKEIVQREIDGLRCSRPMQNIAAKGDHHEEEWEKRKQHAGRHGESVYVSLGFHQVVDRGPPAGPPGPHIGKADWDQLSGYRAAVRWRTHPRKSSYTLAASSCCSNAWTSIPCRPNSCTMRRNLRRRVRGFWGAVPFSIYSTPSCSINQTTFPMR